MSRAQILRHPTRSAWVTGVSGLLVALFLLLKLTPTATPAKWDECLYAYDASRTAQGLVPYRDFFNFTPPAVFYVVGGWSYLWGAAHPLTEGRYLALLLAIASWAFCVRALRRASWGTGSALALASAYPLLFFALWPIPSHHWLGNLAWLVSLEGWDFDSCSVRTRWGWLWVGVMGGAALLTLQTTFLEMAVFWGIAWAVSEPRRGQALVWGASGMALAVAPVLAALAWTGALGPMIRDTVLWTARSYGSEGGPNAVGLLEDVPSRLAGLWHGQGAVAAGPWLLWALAGTTSYLTILGLGTLVAGLSGRELVRRLRMRSLGTGLAPMAMAMTVVSMSLFLRGKTDILHLAYILGPMALAWALALPPARGASDPSERLAFWTGLVVLTAAVVFHLSFLVSRVPAVWEFKDVDRPTREAPLNRWLNSQPWLLPGDTVAAFPEGGQVYLYTRPSAVGHTLLQPLSDRLNGPEDHAQTAREILTRKPRCIVLTSDREADYLDPASPIAEALLKYYDRFAVVADAVVYRLKVGP